MSLLESKAAENVWTRRAVLRSGIFSAGALAASGAVFGCGGSSQSCNAGSIEGTSNLANLGPLQAADANGLRLPPGFTSRIVGRTGEAPTSASSYLWHRSPDGGATFPMCDGGWVYVSNSEVPINVEQGGGCGALRFDAGGEIVDAYSILKDTTFNCGGGPTPWGTWLSCEEDFAEQRGLVFECDPQGERDAVARPALGRFVHEAVAVDPSSGYLYLTEDMLDGGFYRFRPAGAPTDLSAGTLEIAEVVGGDTGEVRWHEVPDPLAEETFTRNQIEASTGFLGGEGIWMTVGKIFFSTKLDNRIWVYDPATQTLGVHYDDSTHPNPILTGVDNVTGTPEGDIIVAEDGGDMEIVVITAAGDTMPLVQIVGHDDSEVTGPAFSPDGSRLYFSSQRGTEGGGFFEGGITFEVTGPFFV